MTANRLWLGNRMCLDNKMVLVTHNVLQVNKAKPEVVDTGSCVQMMLLLLQKQQKNRILLWTESIVVETSNTPCM